MPIHIPKDPHEFFATFIPEQFQQNTAGRALPKMPYSLAVTITNAGRHWYRVQEGRLEHQSGEATPTADIEVELSLEDFHEFVRFAKRHAPEDPPPPPAIPPTFEFPPIDSLAGAIRILLDDLGDKRRVDIRLGKTPAGTAPRVTVTASLDFVAGLQGKSLAVEQIVKSGGVRIDGDLGYLLRVANAFTGKTRRRER